MFLRLFFVESHCYNLLSRTSSSSVTKIPDSGGYLDPETGDWVSTCTNSRGDLNNSEEENSRHGSSRAAKNTQVGSALIRNLGGGFLSNLSMFKYY